MHESLKLEDEIKVGSERAFGIVFACVFGIVALLPLFDSGTVRWWSIAVAAVFLVCAYFFPAVLKPLNILWFKFGMLLYKVVNPMTMALLYYLTVVPMGLLMKAFGKDPLNRSFDPDAVSYWIERDPPGPEPKSMKNQF